MFCLKRKTNEEHLDWRNRCCTSCAKEGVTDNSRWQEKLCISIYTGGRSWIILYLTYEENKIEDGKLDLKKTVQRSGVWITLAGEDAESFWKLFPFLPR